MSLWKESKFNLPGMPSPQGASASSIESTPTPSYNVKDFAKLVPHGETVLIMTEEVKEALKNGGKEAMIKQHDTEFNPRGMVLGGNSVMPLKRPIEQGSNSDEACSTQFSTFLILKVYYEIMSSNLKLPMRCGKL